MKRQNILFIVTALLLALVSGCARVSLEELRGTVEYDGKPLGIGSIMFVPRLDAAQGALPTSCGVRDGAFHLSGRYGITTGTYDVSVSGYDGVEVPANPDDEESSPDPMGKPLFPTYTFVHVFGPENRELNIVVPKK